MARRPKLPAALRSAEIKLKRANLHTRTGTREMMRFFGAHEDPTFRIEPNGEAGVPGIGDEFSFFIVVTTSGYPELPDSFAARFGDAIHNYRCVLDHIAWQLVRHGSNPKPAEPNLIYFPLEWSEKRFWIKRPERLPGVAIDQVNFIHACHAYKRGKASNKSLLSITKLSSDDKHRTIETTVSAISDIHHEMTFTQCQPIGFSGPPSPPALEPDAIVTRVTCIATGAKPHVDMALTPAIYIVLKDGRPMFKVLNEIRIQVESILYAPEIAAGF